MRRNPMVLSGPSGSGKSTLLEKLFAKYPNSFGFSVSHTTRSPRAGESHGKSYYFVSREEFTSMKEKNLFIESAEFSGNLYGTSLKAVKDVKETGKICVLDLEINGVKSMKAQNMDCKFIFIQPPSIEALEKRLQSRKTETEESLKKRLATAKESMDYATETGAYDIVITNDQVDEAFTKFESFILSNWDLADVSTKESTNQKPLDEKKSCTVS